MPPCRVIAIAVAMTFGVLSVGWSQEALDTRAHGPVPEFAASLTAEQFENGNEFLDELGWLFWTLADGLFVANEAEEMVEIDPSELKEMVEGNLEAFQPMIKAQMLFLRKTGNLSDEQFQTISECGEYVVTEALRNHFTEAMKLETLAVHAATPYVEPIPLHRLVQETLTEFAKTQMHADQARLHAAELTARTAHRKRVAILNLVARLDTDLLLLPEQREQFTKLLDSEWQDSWGQSLGALMPDANFIPALPDDKVLAILKDDQRAVWKTTNYNRESTGWDEDPLGLLQEDEELDAEPEGMKPETSGAAKPLVNRD